MNDRYAYIFLDIIFLVIWLIIFLMRSDLRKKMLEVTLLGAVLAIVADLWRFNNYWNPPLLLKFGPISIEDILFACFSLGISATIYDFVFRKRVIKSSKSQHKTLVLLFITGIILILIFYNLFNFNILLVISLTFLIEATVVSCLRKDLLFPSLLSGLLMVFILTIIYFFLFNFLFIGYWDKYWLLKGTVFDLRIFNFPLTELLWYFSVGALLGCVYEFYKGYKKVDLKS